MCDLVLGVALYFTAGQVLGRETQWQEIMQLLDRAERLFPPNAAIFGSAIYAMTKSRRWQEALSLLQVTTATLITGMLELSAVFVLAMFLMHSSVVSRCRVLNSLMSYTCWASLCPRFTIR